jgi:FkbM family methyltransferase
MTPGREERQVDAGLMTGIAAAIMAALHEFSMVPDIETLHFERFDKGSVRRAASLALAVAGRESRYPLEFRAQFGEDALILTLFGCQLDGFFIEVGAFDGYAASVTYVLEAMGWTGLLVEANPERAHECRRRRLHSRVIHAALADRQGEATFVVTHDTSRGMFSHIEGTPGHKKRVLAGNKSVISVPLLTMDHLLASHRGDIDVAVIDVEGSERDLLAGFNLRQHRPKVIVIEDNPRAPAAWLTDHMSELPYTYVAWLKVNRVYVRDDLAPRFASGLTYAAQRV